MKSRYDAIVAIVVAVSAGLVAVHVACAQSAQLPQLDPSPQLPPSPSRARAATSSVPLAEAEPLEVQERFVPYVAQDGSTQYGVQTTTVRPWSPTAGNPLAADPEAAKLHKAEIEAAREAQTFIAQLEGATSEALKAELKGKLRDALLRQFDAQQKRRSLEITGIEERLGKLKDTLKKRDAAKDTIVDRRLDQLMGVGDDLGWEETGLGPAGAKVTAPPLYYPYVAPDPANVPSAGSTKARPPVKPTPPASTPWPVPGPTPAPAAPIAVPPPAAPTPPAVPALPAAPRAPAPPR